jgi:hypothetical protein
MRINPRIALAVALLAVAATAAVLLLAADRTTRGTGVTPGAERPPGTAGVSLGRGSAKDYDPFGGDGEHPEQAAAVLDRDVSSTWSTERYQADLAKDGVGIHVDAKPKVAAVRMDIRTPTPGWSGTVYVADRVPETFDENVWKAVGRIDGAKRTTSVDLDTANTAHRYYLVWITALPEDEDRVQIAEIDLFKRAG